MVSKTPSPEALAAHVEACERWASGYIDPTNGLFVMTSVYLLERGECCGSGCRHCPFSPREQAEAGRPDVGAWPHPPRT